MEKRGWGREGREKGGEERREKLGRGGDEGGGMEGREEWGRGGRRS